MTWDQPSPRGVSSSSDATADEYAHYPYPFTFATEAFGTDRRTLDRPLNAEGIETGVYYIPIHHHTVFEDIDRVDLSTTGSVEDRTLCLPLHPELDESDARDIVSAVEKVTSGV